jgi:hypothetical protein
MPQALPGEHPDLDGENDVAAWIVAASPSALDNALVCCQVTNPAKAPTTARSNKHRPARQPTL